MLKFQNEDQFRVLLSLGLTLSGGLLSNTWMLIGGLGLGLIHLIIQLSSQLQPKIVKIERDENVYQELTSIKSKLEALEFKVVSKR